MSQKLKIIFFVCSSFFLVLNAGAQDGFSEEFESSELDSAWQVWTWDGEPWSYYIPSSFSLTENPGHLRYKLGAMVTPEKIPDLYQYWYYPDIQIWREFRAINWLLEIKVTFYLPYSNAKQFIFKLFYGDIFAPDYCIYLEKSIDHTYSGAPYQFNMSFFDREKRQTFNIQPEEKLRNQRYQTYYFRIIRLDTDFFIFWSKTGSSYALEQIVSFDEEINSLPQGIAISAKSWFSPSGAYADFDYIRVFPVDQSMYADSMSAIAAFFNDPSLFLQSILFKELRFLNKFDKHFPVLASLDRDMAKSSAESRRDKRDPGGSVRSLEKELERCQCLERENGKIVHQLFLDINKSHFLSSQKWLYDRLIKICAQLHKQAPGQGYDRLAFFYAEKMKSQCMLEQMGQYELKNDPFAQRQAELVKKLADLSNQYAKSKDSIDESYKIWERIHGLYIQMGRIKNSKQHLAYEAQHMRKIPVITSERVQKEIINDETALLSYYFCGDQLYLFLVTKSDFHFLVLKNASKISQYVKFYTELISQYFTFDNYDQSSKKVFSQIFAPVFDKVQRMKNLIIIPDSMLNYLPFESLIYSQQDGNEENSFLGLDYNISYAGSASELIAIKKRKEKSAKKKLDFFGVYALYEERNNESAVCAQISSGNIFQEICSFFPRQRKSIFIDEDTTEKALKNKNGIDAKIFHLAAHCTFDPNATWSPKIFLQRRKNSEEDGILELAEVFNLNLNVDVSVLAGCRTGRGKLFQGEGMYNFSRALLSTGSASTIVSLWDVENRSTALFMKYFYEHLLAGATKSEALRLARRDLFSCDNKKYSHPFFWSPFVLTGDYQ